MSTVTRFPRAAALAAGLVLVSCSDSGADVGTFGGGGTPPVLPLAVDFHLRTDLLFGASQVADALAIDLNGDARADLVETNFNDHQVHVALRDVLGGYTADFVLETSGAAWRLVSGDFNGDGLADIAVVEVDDEFGGVNGVSAFFQDAPGSFASSAASAHLALPLSAGGPLRCASLPGLRDELAALADRWSLPMDDQGLLDLLRVFEDPDDGPVADAPEVVTFARLALAANEAIRRDCPLWLVG